MRKKVYRISIPNKQELIDGYLEKKRLSGISSFTYNDHEGTLRRLFQFYNGEIKDKVQSAIIKNWPIWSELLDKINPVNIASNFLIAKEDGTRNKEPYEALIKICKMALKHDGGKSYSKKEIEGFMDCEMIQEVLRIYLNMG